MIQKANTWASPGPPNSGSIHDARPHLISDRDQALTVLHRLERVIQQHDPDPDWLQWTGAIRIDQIKIPRHGVHKIEIHSK
jgi:hypothetical protein